MIDGSPMRSGRSVAKPVKATTNTAKVIIASIIVNPRPRLLFSVRLSMTYGSNFSITPLKAVIATAIVRTGAPPELL